jgi:hypothetical protein
MNEEVPRRDAVVILSVTALIVALIVLFLWRSPGSAGAARGLAPAPAEIEGQPAALSISGDSGE